MNSIQFIYSLDKTQGLVWNKVCKYLNNSNTTTTTSNGLSYFIDVLDKNHVSGWIWNQKKPHFSVSINIVDNKQILTRINSDKYRQDLLNANIGDGKHAFDYIFPESIKDNRLHKISLSCNQKIIFSSYIYLPINNFVRKYISKKYIKGSGVEIGALHNPLWVSSKAKVKYVDRFDKPTLIKTYPELNALTLTDVDIIDDGEKLSTIPNNSLDFIICNHMLEHCQNPIGTIRSHLSKIKTGGILYYAIPNKRYTFDSPRKLTSLKHLISDNKLGPNKSRRLHLTEWATHIDKVIGKKELQNRVQFLDKIKYSIHYHVWNEITFLRFLIATQTYLAKQFQIFKFVENDKEIISILKKINN